MDQQSRRHHPGLAPPDDTQLSRESWKIFQIMAEFVEGFERLAQIKPSVSIFGSARTAPEHPYYKLAEDIARALSDSGFSVVSGGGPGIMEAANKGAFEAGAPSIGFNITLPHEQDPNAWSTPDLTFNFHYFAMRKMHLAMRSNGLVVFPGGFGTMDELFEILTLVQTGKMSAIPIVLFDRDFWTRVVNLEVFIEAGTISPGDVNLFHYAETAEEAWDHLVKAGILEKTPLQADPPALKPLI